MRKFWILLLSWIMLLAPIEAAATTTKVGYGTSNQTITITITSLGSANYRQSTVIDNSSNLFLDVLVMCKVKTGTASGTGYVAIYGYGTADGGTTYDGGASGSDSAYTVDATPPNLVLIGILNANASAITVQRMFSVATAFGGQMPQKWGIIVSNQSGAALDASVGSCWYQGVNATSS